MNLNRKDRTKQMKKLLRRKDKKRESLYLQTHVRSSLLSRKTRERESEKKNKIKIGLVSKVTTFIFSYMGFLFEYRNKRTHGRANDKKKNGGEGE